MRLDIKGVEQADRPGASRSYRFASSSAPGIVLVLDIAALLIAAGLAFAICVKARQPVMEYYFFASVFISFITIYLLRDSRMYEMNAIMRPLSRSDVVMVSVGSAFLFFFAMAMSLKAGDIYSMRWVYWFLGLSILLLCMGRVAIKYVLLALARMGVVGRSLVVFGTRPQASRFVERLQHLSPFFTDIRGVFLEDEGTAGESRLGGLPLLGGPQDLMAYVRAEQVDDVVVAMPWSDDGALTRVVDDLKELPVNVYISMDLAGYVLEFRPVVGQLNQLPLFEIVQRPISGWHYVLKRIEDYVLATFLAIVLSPLMALIALAIKLDSPGPVFFMQKRLGFNNEVFEIYKFRSMYHGPDPGRDFKQAQKDDPRITRVGRILRRVSLDELPQLFNVLDGSMSLVGPRPHALRHNEEYGRKIRGYFARHRVKPGITGWAQVKGFRGETETISKMEQRVKHDVYYAENWSLLFDLRILVMTVIVVLFQKNAY